MTYLRGKLSRLERNTNQKSQNETNALSWSSCMDKSLMRLRTKYRVMITLRSLDTGSMGSSVNSKICLCLIHWLTTYLRGKLSRLEKNTNQKSQNETNAFVEALVMYKSLMRLRSKYRVMITLRSLDTVSMGSSVNSKICLCLIHWLTTYLRGNWTDWRRIQIRRLKMKLML